MLLQAAYLLHFESKQTKSEVNQAHPSEWNQKLTAALLQYVTARWSSVVIYSSIKWISNLLTSSHSASCSFTCQQVATDNDTMWKITSNMLQWEIANAHRWQTPIKIILCILYVKLQLNVVMDDTLLLRMLEGCCTQRLLFENPDGSTVSLKTRNLIIWQSNCWVTGGDQ